MTQFEKSRISKTSLSLKHLTAEQAYFTKKKLVTSKCCHDLEDMIWSLNWSK